jgi:hypothetical protein
VSPLSSPHTVPYHPSSLKYVTIILRRCRSSIHFIWLE